MTQASDLDAYNKAWNEGDPDNTAKTSDASSLLGSGMAKQAADAIKGRAYQLHVQEAKAMGEPPMTPEQFIQSQKGQK